MPSATAAIAAATCADLHAAQLPSGEWFVASPDEKLAYFADYEGECPVDMGEGRAKRLAASLDAVATLETLVDLLDEHCSAHDLKNYVAIQCRAIVARIRG